MTTVATPAKLRHLKVLLLSLRRPDPNHGLHCQNHTQATHDLFWVKVTPERDEAEFNYAYWNEIWNMWCLKLFSTLSSCSFQFIAMLNHELTWTLHRSLSLPSTPVSKPMDSPSPDPPLGLELAQFDFNSSTSISESILRCENIETNWVLLYKCLCDFLPLDTIMLLVSLPLRLLVYLLVHAAVQCSNRQDGGMVGSCKSLSM